MNLQLFGFFLLVADHIHFKFTFYIEILLDKLILRKTVTEYLLF